jgi:hypothetical protein
LVSEVEVVGRLVEHQEVGRVEEHQRQHEARLLAAAEELDALVLISSPENWNAPSSVRLAPVGSRWNFWSTCS